MHKKRLKVVLVVLNAVKIKYPEKKKQFIDDTMEEEYQKEKISAREVFFLQV